MQTANTVQCVHIIINTMCNKGFMNGWFGDTDQDFRDKQNSAFLSMSYKERVDWIERNKFNLTKYCRVPEWVLSRAVMDLK